MKVNEVSTPLDLTNLDSACLAVRQARPDKPRQCYPHNINLNNSFCLILETDTMA